VSQLAFIFDLDGTLIDTTAYYRQVWEEFIRELESDLTADHLLAHSAREGLRQMLGKRATKAMLDAHVLRQAQRGREIMAQRGVRAHRGIPELIAGLRARGVRLGLATLAERENAEFPLEQLGILDHFDGIVANDQVTHGKPHPEVYLKVLEKMQVRAENCAAMEDAPQGVAAAQAAGLRVIAVTNTHSRAQLQNADWIIGSAADVSADDIIKFIHEKHETH
jgi:beta-phosphoglucomutase